MAVPPLSDADYERFRELIVNRTGLDFPPSRREDFGVWLRRALDQIQDTVRYHPMGTQTGPVPTNLDELYAALLASNVLVWDTVIDALTVCETHFFRNAPQFDALREDILPELIATRRKQGKLALNLWSAGCASGEEAYSLAILLRELLPDWQSWQLNILGTDINKRSLVQARHGVYRDWSFREAYAHQVREEYFERIDIRYHLHDDVRNMVQFEACSLVESCGLVPGPAGRMDVNLCRNVILYLGENVRRWIYQRLQQALMPGGWLIVGHADPPPPGFAAFQPTVLHNTTFYRSVPPSAIRKRKTAPPAAESQPLAPEVEQEPSVAPAEIRSARTDADTHYRLGRWHANRQHWNEALYHCERAITLAPTYTEVYYTLSLIHKSLGDDENAIEDLRRAIYLERNWALPRFMLAGIYRERGQVERARRELRNVLAITGTLAPDTAMFCGDGMTAARLHEVAERQLTGLPPSPLLPDSE